jgi:hypothetical protein
LKTVKHKVAHRNLQISDHSISIRKEEIIWWGGVIDFWLFELKKKLVENIFEGQL